MFHTLLRAKLHNVVVTDAQLHYVGSVTIDENLMKAVGLLPNEKVLIVNNKRGSRIETYVIKGKPGSGVICLNGAAAHHFAPGEEAIIMAFGHYDQYEAKFHRPKVIFPSDKNTKWKTPKEVVYEMLKMDALEQSEGFDLEYIDKLALQMAFTPEEIIGFIADLKYNVKQ
jgi:aspartate 1-decarboxylase